MTIKPFTIAIAEEEVADLRNRLKHTRWPQTAVVDDWSRGMPLAYAKKLAGHWRTKYDWRAQEAKLNKYPQFVADVDGQAIHFFHIRSEHEDATPLLLAHGYPSSFVDFLQMIDPLVNPETHDGKAEDAFHLVIPSMPGFGFSTPVTDKGWDITRTAHAYDDIMKQLGYEQYGVHGGDVGAGICEQLCILGGERVIGALATTDAGAIATQYTPPTDHLTAKEKAKLQKLKAARSEDFGYINIQSTRPQTISYGLTDSAVGQMAWIVEKFKEWTDPKHALPENAVDIDQLLTNVSIYWFGQSGAGAANFLYEAMHAAAAWGKTHDRPLGFSVYGTEPLIRRILDPQGKVSYWSEHSTATHFPSYEEPKLLVDDLRAFFRQLQSAK